MFRKLTAFVVVINFLCSSVLPVQLLHAQTILDLPKPGTMISTTAAYTPVQINGLRVDLKDPFSFGFIVNTGDTGLKASDQKLRLESEKLIKYFFATLATPDKDLWVNLSPYEKDRMIMENLGKTELGRDMLAQDYILKQLTASLVYPESDTGKAFWSSIYQATAERFGSAEIPVDTFNKVWITPDKAVVYEKNGAAFVLESHLKVMLETDYLAVTKNGVVPEAAANTDALSSRIAREILIPALEKEVNEGQNFAAVRQMSNAMILATWYKKALKESILSQVYVNKNKINGINLADTQAGEKIYQQYLEAFRKGAFNYIKDEVDRASGETVPRKYFSGGLGYEKLGDVTETFERFEDLPNNAQKVAEEMGADAEKTVEIDATLLARNEELKTEAKQFTRDTLEAVNQRLAGLDGLIGEALGKPLSRNMVITRTSMDQPVPLHSTGKRFLRPQNIILAPAGDDGSYIAGVSQATPGPVTIRMKFLIEEALTKDQVKEKLKEKIAELGLGEDIRIVKEEDGNMTARVLKKREIFINENEIGASSVKGVGTQVVMNLIYDEGDMQNEVTDGLGIIPSFRTPPVETTRDEVRIPLLRRIKIGIYGPGRTGITIARQLLLSNSSNDIELVLDLYQASEVRRRLMKDSSYEDLPAEVSEVKSDNDGMGEYFFVTVGDVTHKVYGVPHDRTKGIEALPWKKYGIDIAIDATGRVKDHEGLVKHIKAGAKRALLTQPSKADKTKGTHDTQYEAVYGVNEDQIPLDAQTLSGASCTTNGLVFMLLGIMKFAKVRGGRTLGGDADSIHAFTGTQPLTDGDPTGKEGASAIGSEIQAPTGAAKAIGPLMKKVGERTPIEKDLTATALRVGNPTGSFIDLTRYMSVAEDMELTAADVNAYFQSLSEGQFKYNLAVESGLISSRQIMGRAATTLLVPEMTVVKKIKPGLYEVTLGAWYDNEWGYSTQVNRLVRVIGAKLIEQEVRNEARPMSEKRTMADLLQNDLKGKTVAVRVDYSVPVKDGEVQDVTRIVASQRTIAALRKAGAKVVLISHMGRPKDPMTKYLAEGISAADAKARVEKELSLAPVVGVVEAMLDKKIIFDPQYRTMAGAKDVIADMGNGDVLLVENTRFDDGDEKNDPLFAADLLAGADHFVLDATSVIHRAHASVMAVPGVPRYEGYLLEDELKVLDKVSKTAKVGVMGGAKVADKIGVIKAFLDADPDRKVLIGGAMAHAFIKATGMDIGASIGGDEASVKIARELLDKYGEARIILPKDFVAVDDFKAPKEYRRIKRGEVVPEGWSMVDIGIDTSVAYVTMIRENRGTTFWNGPMGAFDFLPLIAADGTRWVANQIASQGERGVIGGGDSVTAYNVLVDKEIRRDSRAKILTGGGASLERLEGKSLPGVDNLSPRPTKIESLTPGGTKDPVVKTWLEAVYSDSRLIGDWKKIVPDAVVSIARMDGRQAEVGTRTGEVFVDGSDYIFDSDVAFVRWLINHTLNGVASKEAQDVVFRFIPSAGLSSEMKVVAVNLIRGVLIHRYGVEAASKIPVMVMDNASLGGIDFNPDLLNLQIKRDANGMPLSFDQQPVAGKMDFNVFYPVILKITPAVDMKLLLGLQEHKLMKQAA